MVAMNSTENLSYILNGIYSVLTKSTDSTNSKLYLSLPHYDFITKGSKLKILLLNLIFFCFEKF